MISGTRQAVAGSKQAGRSITSKKCSGTRTSPRPRPTCTRPRGGCKNRCSGTTRHVLKDPLPTFVVIPW
jgi:hypothetical protein